MKTSTLRRLLEDIRDGKVEVQEGVRQMRTLPFEDLGFAKVDSHRELRVGYPEVIYGEGKTHEQVLAIAERLLEAGGPVLITRTTAACHETLAARWPHAEYGIHRLLDHIQVLQSSRVLVVVAGMEGALPSVVAGLTSAPVIAVPTSVGYGTGLGGLAALAGMLNSCASGLMVVNIDNGFGAGFAAATINRQSGVGA